MNISVFISRPLNANINENVVTYKIKNQIIEDEKNPVPTLIANDRFCSEIRDFQILIIYDYIIS